VKISYIKLELFFKGAWNAVLGIFTETAFAAIFIIAGFAVCALWWLVLR
jgi:hypothetical protein